MEKQFLIALGANLPFRGRGPAATLRAAIATFPAVGIDVIAVSRLFATPCFPPGAGPDYVNAAAVIATQTHCDVASVLIKLHEVEQKFGRRRGTRWGMRSLDLDLLAAGDSVLPDAATQTAWRSLPPETQRVTTPEELVLPHPRLQDRAFVLVPLADVAPAWRHPILGLTVAEMLAALPESDRSTVVALPANPALSRPSQSPK